MPLTVIVAEGPEPTWKLMVPCGMAELALPEALGSDLRRLCQVVDLNAVGSRRGVARRRSGQDARIAGGHGQTGEDVRLRSAQCGRVALEGQEPRLDILDGCLLGSDGLLLILEQRYLLLIVRQ